jgi:hypothetical protein
MTTPDFSKLDYTDIKQNLINFLKTQDKFSGYNFEGSALNILMDVLAYNTHYQSIYNNITFNEAFLDTAQKRSSVVSIAKNLGYTPSSSKAASCLVEVIRDANSDGTLTEYVLSKYNEFKASKNGTSYSFYNQNDITFTPHEVVNNVPVSYTSGPIKIQEGLFREVFYVIDGTFPNKKITLRFLNIDTDTIQVKVQRSVSDSTGSADEWIEAKNITNIDGNSNAYFLEEGPDSYYQIYFGDGIVGKRLSEGNLVTISFLECSGAEPNGIGITDTVGARVFTSPDSVFSETVIVLTPAFGGAERETIESIKYKAPKSFTTQERAVTANDYSIILQKDFSFIKSIKCWGGEENNPPEYGKVFIAIKPENRAALSQAEKNTILKSLTKDRSVVGVIPQIVDPNVLYLIINCDAKVDIVKNKGTITQLKAKIKTAIDQYILTNLDVFDADLIANELENNILNSDKSLLSVNVTPQLEYRLLPVYGFGRNYQIEFQNEIVRSDNIQLPNLQSTVFNYFDYQNNVRLCRLYDDGKGGIYIGFENNGKKYSLGTYQNKDISVMEPEVIGSIDYASGLVKINNFNPINQLNNQIIKFFVNLVDIDVFVNPNTILTIDNTNPSSVVINLTESAFRKPIK